MRLIPFFLVSLFLLAGLLGLTVLLVTRGFREREVLPRAHVAIVPGSDGSDDSSDAVGRVDLTTRLAIGLVEGMESVKSLCTIDLMSPRAAAEGLAEGDVDAAIYLPDGTYEDINNGVNTPVLFRISGKRQGLAGALFEQLVADGVTLIRAAEAAIYAVDAAAASNPPQISLGEAEDRLFGAYLSGILGRDALFAGASLSALGELTLVQFYGATGALLLLLFFGIGFASFYGEGERAASRYLSRRGLPPWKTALAGVLAVTVVYVLLILVLRGVTLGVRIRFGDKEAEAAKETLLPALRSLPCLLATAFSLAAFIHLLYSCLPVMGAALRYLLLAVLLFILTGGILPVAYLPGILREAAAFSPVSVWQRALALFLFGADSGRGVFGNLPASAAALLVGGCLLLPALPGGYRHA